ncbi:MAG: hypothetical protein ACKO40_01770 [Planctomycetaceae bacterium]
MGSIREELRRFERRRLRPLFRRFKRRRADPAPACLQPGIDARMADDHEELIVALARAELRRRAAGHAADPVLEAATAAGRTEAERLVRSLLDADERPAAAHAPRSEAA